MQLVSLWPDVFSFKELGTQLSVKRAAKVIVPESGSNSLRAIEAVWVYINGLGHHTLAMNVWIVCDLFGAIYSAESGANLLPASSYICPVNI